MSNRRLDDKKWQKIYRFLQLTPNIYTGNEEKIRTFVEGVYWIMRKGTLWRDLPEKFGKWNSIFRGCLKIDSNNPSLAVVKSDIIAVGPTASMNK